MFAKWIRNLIASSLYNEVKNCSDCTKHGGGFDNYTPCNNHEGHIELHNTLTSINNG